MYMIKRVAATLWAARRPRARFLNILGVLYEVVADLKERMINEVVDEVEGN